MNRIQFHALCSAVYLATINSFAVLWVQQNQFIIDLSTEHAQETTAYNPMQWHLPSQETVVPEIILWRLATYAIGSCKSSSHFIGRARLFMDLEPFLATITVDHFPFFVQWKLRCKLLALAEQVSYCKLSTWYSFSTSTEASAPAVLLLL